MNRTSSRHLQRRLSRALASPGSRRGWKALTRAWLSHAGASAQFREVAWFKGASGSCRRGLHFPAFCVVLTVLFIALAVTAQAVSNDCDIQRGPCVPIISNGLSIVFDIQPKPVASMSENTFIVTLGRSGKPITTATVHLDLSMPGMFMGNNEVVLKHIKGGRYEGNGIIPRCASGRKTWQADVAIQSAETTTVVGFIFEVK